MQYISLTQSKYTLVDNEDFEWLNKWNWYFGGKGYAIRNSSKKLGKNRKRIISMQNEIMSPIAGFQVDHIDGDCLNNQRSNLRLCTQSQNNMNRHSKNKTGFKGVTIIKRNYFKATITKDKKQIYLGDFKDIVDAAKAYDQAALKYHGEFARLNFPK